MRKLFNCLTLILSIWCFLFISSPSEAATVNNHSLNHEENKMALVNKLKKLQVEVKALNEEKDNLNDQINRLYPKKKNNLVNQLRELETSNSQNKQTKLKRIQKQIDVYKEAITLNNNLKMERKKLWGKYKKQIAKDNIMGSYKTLRLIRQNLLETIENNKFFLENLSAK